MTDNVIKNIHNYDLSNITINLVPHRYVITEKQIDILKSKYQSETNKTILLSKSTKGIESKDNIVEESQSFNF